MKTDTDWNITIKPNGKILALSVDYVGEIPNVKAYTALLDALGKWAKKNSAKELRVMGIPKMMSVG
ncbi:hypothetical protein [Sulfuricurvum sp.]|uniref:hypothetical protein n=1 Tax=Sulfuricurvum sp. TaxID=2025608 RepID=UPI00260A412E|nr:hypothetical protein [Sulfuricurvum sp.]MDD2267485.1 hypothetical protein [Sulfuricurvum sp.]MDD2783967.1 hypothetical protein [Sulfuricurvum sp.]